MPVKFIPTGSLDITTNASLLPQDTSDDGKLTRSGAMRRCTNMRIDENGIARTRFGSTKGSMAIHAANAMIELSGTRYEFGGDEIYADEVSIASGLTNAQWTATISRAANSSTDAIYAINGTDRKRIENGVVAEWGIAGPTTPLSSQGTVNYAYTHSWETDEIIGTATTTLEDCEATTNWTGSPASSTLTADTTYYKVGSKSLKIVTNPQAGDTQQYAKHTLNASGQDLSSYLAFGFWIRRYDDIDYTQTCSIIFEDTAGAQVSCTFSTPANETWNKVTMLKGDFAAVAGTGTLDWTIVEFVYIKRYLLGGYSYVRMYIDEISGYTTLSQGVSKFTRNYNDTHEYVYSWEDDHLADDDTLPLSDRNKNAMWLFEYGSAYVGVPYYIKYTYVRKSGESILYESNPSAETMAIPINTILLSWTTPADEQVTHIRFYRKELTGDVYYFDSEWPVEDARGFINSHDDDLGALVTEDNDRPPLGSVIIGPAYGGYLFMAVDNDLYWCKGNQPEVWPALYYVEVSPSHQPIKALCIFAGLVYAFTEFGIYQIQGTSAASFYPIKMTAHTGAKNQYSVAVIPNHGILHIGNDGIYLWNTTGDVNITKGAFNTLFYAQTSENVPYLYETYLSRCFFLPFKDKVFFFYPESTDSYPSNLLVFDLKEGRTVHYDYGTQFTAGCVDYTNDRLYVCDSSGYIWQLENESVTTDNSTAISWQIQSKAFADPLYKYFPRYAKYDVTVGTGGTAQGDILLNEVSKQTHTLTGSRNTRKRLVAGCTGDRLSVRLSGTGTVTFYGVEVE